MSLNGRPEEPGWPLRTRAGARTTRRQGPSTAGLTVVVRPGRQRLHVDKKAAAQLFTTSGYSQIESKKAMKARGMKSPDRAEAVLLTLYEPDPLNKPRRRGLLN
ncbi:hypothetical protein ABTX35_32910 [Streptomyces sp. NPDC096080]|uniref:hypothetical protein n=1 Tax=Streptomyces sp. NPDC096080 TaxID=3156693 RepID=UPI00331C9526